MADQVAKLTRQIESLYGQVDWPRQDGVLHVAAIASRPRVAIRIGPAAPASGTDRFVLGLARARADAIVTTGAILRAEPALLHRYAEDERAQQDLSRWRAEVLSRSAPPALIVLSGSGRFPLDHPAVAAARAGCVWTSGEGARRLGSRLGALSVQQDEEVGAEGSTAAGALARLIAWARRREAFSTISIEAGPSATTALYALPPKRASASHAESDAGGDHDRRSPGGVDELLLSTFEGPLAQQAIGPDFVSQDSIQARLGVARSCAARQEESGPWRFERYRRRPDGSLAAGGAPTRRIIG